MNREIALYSCFILAATFIGAISQVMLKTAAGRYGADGIRAYLNPLVVSAYGLFFGTTLLTVIAYKKVPLSLGPVLESTSYIYAVFFGWLIFKERISVKKMAAILMIVAGIVVSSLAGQVA